MRVTPQLGQKDKKGPEFDAAHHDMYSGADGYKFDYDIRTAGQPYAHSLAQGPEFNVAHHDMYPGPDGYNFDFDKSLRGD